MATGTAGTSARQFSSQQTHYLIKKVVHTDDGTELTVGYVPAGSVVINARAEVTEAFNDGGTDQIDIGYAADPDEFCVNLDVSSTGTKLDATTFNAAANKVFTSDTEIVCQYDGSSSDATAGVAYVIVEYVVDAAVVDSLTD